MNILSTLTEQHKIGDMCEAEAILSALITSHCYEELILGSAVNNYSICALYLKRINQAIAQLESLIAINPPLYMIDPVVFNLCTLYDLSYAPDVSTTKKKSLQKVAIEFHIDDPILHWKSFRLN